MAKLIGVVIESLCSSCEEILFAGDKCSWDILGSDEDKRLELWVARTDELLTLLNGITHNYMCGQEDGKFYVASDCEEGIKAISDVFIGFNTETIYDEEVPWDYDYRRDRPLQL